MHKCIELSPFKAESGKLAKLKLCIKFVLKCQQWGLGWGLVGALGWGWLQLVGSEVTSRCPSQPPTLGCFSFVRVLISICQISLACNLGAHKKKCKKHPAEERKCFLGWFHGLFTQATDSWNKKQSMLNSKKSTKVKKRTPSTFPL